MFGLFPRALIEGFVFEYISTGVVQRPFSRQINLWIVPSKLSSPVPGVVSFG